MTFSERSFRDALGLFPTGVAVVTTITGDGTRVGATVSSFNSVSLSAAGSLQYRTNLEVICGLEQR